MKQEIEKKEKDGAQSMVTPRKAVSKNPIQLPCNTIDSAPEAAFVDDGVAVDKTLEIEVVNVGEGCATPPDVDWGSDVAPKTWLETEALKVPVIPVRVNLAEKDWAGYLVPLSLRLRDSMRMK